MSQDYIITSGPALATASAPVQYLSLLNTKIGQNVAMVAVERASQLKTVVIVSSLDAYDEVYAFLNFLTTIARQYRGHPLTLTDANATKMADVVTFSQSLAEFKSLLAGLSIVVEASIDSQQTNGKANSVRFIDANVVGLSQVKTASSIVMTIKAS